MVLALTSIVVGGALWSNAPNIAVIGSFIAFFGGLLISGRN